MQSILITLDEPKNHVEVMDLLISRVTSVDTRDYFLVFWAVCRNMARENALETSECRGTTRSSIAPSLPKAASQSRREHKLMRMMLMLMELLRCLMRLPFATILLVIT